MMDKKKTVNFSDYHLRTLTASDWHDIKLQEELKKKEAEEAENNNAGFLKKLVGIFGKADKDFVDFLNNKFGEETAEKVLNAFDKIELPAPGKATQFLKSNEGCVIFLNKYGLVVRVENKTPEKGYYARVNDSGAILQPLVSIDAGNAVVEICPGCHVERDEASIEYLKNLLHNEGLVFSDPQLENIGRLDTDNPEYPDGLLLIIDRLAVSRMKEDVNVVSIDNNQFIVKSKEEQLRFSAPFRRVFREGLKDSSRMHEFWTLVESYASEGKLIAGWNVDSEFFDKIGFFSKTSKAEEVAKQYSLLLEKYEKKRAKAQA